MRSQIPFTYAKEKPLYSVLMFKKWRFFLHLRKCGHPSLSLHVHFTPAKIREKEQETQRPERICAERGTEGWGGKTRQV